MGGYPHAMNAVQSGAGKAIAVSMTKRNKRLPDVPTFIEQGVRSKVFALVPYIALAGPTGMPQQIVERLSALMVKAGKSERVQKLLETYGIDESAQDHIAFRKLYDTEVPIGSRPSKRWGWRLSRRAREGWSRKVPASMTPPTPAPVGLACTVGAVLASTRWAHANTGLPNNDIRSVEGRLAAAAGGPYGRPWPRLRCPFRGCGRRPVPSVARPWLDVPVGAVFFLNGSEVPIGFLFGAAVAFSSGSGPARHGP